MTLDYRPVSIQIVCTENLPRTVQLILCLTVNKLTNVQVHVQVSVST